MYSSFQLAKKYLHYFLTASNGKGHGIHSPFIFDFIINVLNDNRQFYAYHSIEALRRELLKDNTILEVEDFGAGSVTGRSKHRSIASIAVHASKNKKLSQLLFRMAHYYKPGTIIELGTSLGISSAYLGAANPGARVLTLEGATSIAERARQHHSRIGIDNIEVITGNFESTLSEVLWPLEKVDLAFVDGNHKSEPTKKYFRQLLDKASDQAIFIFDDIHWSSEMEEAWRYIRGHPDVTATIDLFFIGIVLFRPEFKSRQEFTIRF